MSDETAARVNGEHADDPSTVETDNAFVPMEAGPGEADPRNRFHFAEVALDTSPSIGRLASFLSINDTLWDGKPFPWFTVGPMTIELGRRDVAKITLVIPVKLVAPPEPEPDRPADVPGSPL